MPCKPRREYVLTYLTCAALPDEKEPCLMPARFSLDTMPSLAYKLLIVAATAVWGISFVFMKDVVEVLPPAWLLGIRFTCAGIILFAILRKRVTSGFNLRVLGMGIVLGILDFSAFFAQTVGLQHTTPGINAFLTATYCVIVPFIWWLVAHRKPTFFNLGAALLAIGGIWLVSVSSSDEGLTMGLGEGLTLVAAVIFALHIVAVSKFSQHFDALGLTVLQFLTEGVLGLIVGGLTEPAPAFSVFTPDIIGQMVFLVLFASIFAFGAQNLALAHVPPAQASLLLSLESVFGVVFSVIMTGEQLTVRLLVGFVLIFAAIMVSELLPVKKKEAVEAVRQ